MKTLDPNSPKPPSQQIADAIREAIRGGELKPGDRLPGRAELMTHFGVAAATLNSALATLKQGGILVSRQGSGVFVRTDIDNQHDTEPTVDHLASINARLARIERHLGIDTAAEQ
ncbi:GntR family transcriptional regulator [Kutzneria albida]|uniref:HTH gntR-type domain-containing protein n=1 Tax=Kutzneria albida DSM 43870 TaxID=1449976 RepID=W5WJE6_9PSEU|nr:GntR family transcriptional regulator [Kutzneria albida]AHH98284.1 hypothetical protein KALB_4922 [Kutzneria albida DSM 43870]